MPRQLPSKRSSTKPAPPSTLIPHPFTAAPPSLSPFLSRLDPSLVHITHIDRHPASHKRTIFLIPVALNATIALLLLYRASIALPHYILLLRTMLGHTTPATVDATTTSRTYQFRVLLFRVAGMFADFVLFRFVGPWPLTFFAEQPANPCSWRWNLGGFKQEEVVVRVSRGWGCEEMMKGVRQGKENAWFRNRVLPAIEAAQMRKTGYLMMNGDWDLEFEVMGDAHTLVGRGEVEMKALDGWVWAFEEGMGWIGWKWEGTALGEEERRGQVVKFKEKLVGMGKESLFWTWAGIVEEERDLDGGFTKERQERVKVRVTAEFEKEGVDFDGLVDGIGGLGEIALKKE